MLLIVNDGSRAGDRVSSTPTDCQSWTRQPNEPFEPQRDIIRFINHSGCANEQAQFPEAVRWPEKEGERSQPRSLLFRQLHFQNPLCGKGMGLKSKIELADNKSNLKKPEREIVPMVLESRERAGVTIRAFVVNLSPR
jgi:hypothetical protein